MFLLPFHITNINLNHNKFIIMIFQLIISQINNLYKKSHKHKFKKLKLSFDKGQHNLKKDNIF